MVDELSLSDAPLSQSLRRPVTDSRDSHEPGYLQLLPRSLNWAEEITFAEVDAVLA